MARGADALGQLTDEIAVGKTPIQTLMFSDPHRRWDKTRPFVLSVGGHVLVLALLCASFLREPQPAPRQTGASVVEATLVSASLQAEIDQANSPSQPVLQPPQPPPQPEPPSVMPQEPSLKPADVGPDAAKPAAEQVAEQHQPQESDAGPKHAQVIPSSQPQQDGENSPNLAQQQTDASDPYAEMRRLRAEAERQHQLDEQNIHQSATAGMPPIPVAPAIAPADNHPTHPWIVDPPATTIPFDFSGAWALGNDTQSMRCLPGAFQRTLGDSISMDWIDCLLEIVLQDPASQMLLIER